MSVFIGAVGSSGVEIIKINHFGYEQIEGYPEYCCKVVYRKRGRTYYAVFDAVYNSRERRYDIYFPSKQPTHGKVLVGLEQALIFWMLEFQGA
jgi:hypothetical protein